MQSQARDARETGDIYPRGQVLAKECEMTLCSAEAYKLVSKKGKANDSATGNQVCRTIAEEGGRVLISTPVWAAGQRSRKSSEKQ